MKAVLLVVTLIAQMFVAGLPAQASAPFAGSPGRPAADDPYPSLIEGVVFVDADHSGYADYDEPQLFDVTLVLSGTDDLGQPVLMSTTTGVGGWPYFSLEVTRPGTYTLSLLGLTEYSPAGAYADDALQPDPNAISLAVEAESYHNVRFSVWPSRSSRSSAVMVTTMPSGLLTVLFEWV